MCRWAEVPFILLLSLTMNKFDHKRSQGVDYCGHHLQYDSRRVSCEKSKNDY